MNTRRFGDSPEQTRTHRPLSCLSVAVGGCLLVLATAMPAARGQQEIPLDVSPEMLSGSLEFFASPSGLAFATPLPYGVANNLNDYGWIWQDGSYLTVTFPSPVALSRIRVYCVFNESERGAQWVVEHSSDNSSWVHAADFTYSECFGCGVDDNGVPMTGTGGWYSVACNESGQTDLFWRIRQTHTLNGHAPRSGVMEFYGLIGPPPTNAPPSLIREPVSQTVWLGTPVTFKVIAWGTAPLSYQWRFNGTALPAATTNIFTLSAVQEVDAGEYDVVITNNYGSVTSRVAVLRVIAAPASDILYVAERYNGNVVAIDTVSGEGRVVASGLGAMIGIAVDRKGRIFVSRFGWGSGDTIAQVDPVTGSFWDIAAPGGVFGIFADPDSDTLYVGGYGSPTVYRIQETSPDVWTVDTAVSFPESPGLVKHAFRDGNLLYVTCDGNGFWAKDLTTGILNLVVPVGVPVGGTIIAREAGGDLIVGSEGDSVYRIDTSTGQVVEIYSGFCSACGVAVNPIDNFLYVAEQCGKKITRIDLATGLRTTASTAVETPWQIAFAQKAALPLSLNPPVLSAGTLTLSWNGGPGIKLQKTTSLTGPNWQDVSGSEGLSQIELPCTDAAAFFRLIKP